MLLQLAGQPRVLAHRFSLHHALQCGPLLFGPGRLLVHPGGVDEYMKTESVRAQNPEPSDDQTVLLSQGFTLPACRTD